MQKGIIVAENFGALMISYSEIGWHVLAPFLDTYPGLVEYGSARQSNGYWSVEGLPMRAVADVKTTEYG